jgi:hypothetical protein
MTNITKAVKERRAQFIVELMRRQNCHLFHGVSISKFRENLKIYGTS